MAPRDSQAAPGAAGGELLGVANMTTWCKGMAAAAVGLVLGGTAQAQYGPTPMGGPRPQPEPIPCAPSPNLAPGPLTPLDAPPGPPPGLDLPANHPSAFQSENLPPEEAVYFHVGAQFLRRQTPNSQTIGTLLVTNSDGTTSVQPAQSVHDLQPTLSGVRGSLGYLFNDSAIEVTGFYLPNSKQTQTTTVRGRLGAAFPNQPAGFQTSGDLFTGGDQLSSSLSSRLGNVELNYRYANAGINDIELILGVRYVDQHDSLDILVDHNALTLPAAADLPFQAAFQTAASNRIIAPQVGFEYHHQLFTWLSYGMNAKGAWGANFTELNTQLTRGDGYFGTSTRQTDTVFSQVYDLGVFLEFHVLDRVKLRGGYNTLWLVGTTSAPANLNTDLGTAGKLPFEHNNTIFYQGAQIEVQFLF